MKRFLSFAAIAFVTGYFCQPHLHAQSSSAQTRLRPLGSPSAVDQFRSNVQRSTSPRYAPVPVSSASVAKPSSSVRNETALWRGDTKSQPSASVRQTVWMQSNNFEPPPLPGGMAFPDTGTAAGNPAASPAQPGGMNGFPNSTPFPEAASPPASPAPSPPLASPPARALPSPPVSQNQPIGSPSDYSPIPQPSLQERSYARVDNCHLVTGPSNYTAAMATGCGYNQIVPAAYAVPTCNPPISGPVTAGPGSYPTEIASPATIPPVTVYPPVTRPNAFANSSAPARSLITFGQENYPVQVGQGLWGQPVAYVPGQGVRNWLRYLSP